MVSLCVPAVAVMRAASKLREAAGRLLSAHQAARSFATVQEQGPRSGTAVRTHQALPRLHGAGNVHLHCPYCAAAAAAETPSGLLHAQ